MVMGWCAGLGPIGLCAIRWCQIKGAKTVIAIDMVKDRLELARKTFSGVTLIDRNEEKNVAQKVRSSSPFQRPSALLGQADAAVNESVILSARIAERARFASRQQQRKRCSCKATIYVCP